MLGKEIRDFSNRLGIDRFDNVRAFYDALKASGEFEDSALLLVFDEAQLGKLAGGSKERPQETSLGLLLRSRAAKAGSGKRFGSNILRCRSLLRRPARTTSPDRARSPAGRSRRWFATALQRCGLLGVLLVRRSPENFGPRGVRIEKDGEEPAHDRALHYHPAHPAVTSRPRLRLRGDPALLPGLLPLVLYGAAGGGARAAELDGPPGGGSRAGRLQAQGWAGVWVYERRPARRRRRRSRARARLALLAEMPIAVVSCALPSTRARSVPPLRA